MVLLVFYIPTMFDQAKLNCNLSRRSVRFVLLKKSFYNLYDIVLLDTTLSLIQSTQWAKIEEFPNNNSCKIKVARSSQNLSNYLFISFGRLF